MFSTISMFTSYIIIKIGYLCFVLLYKIEYIIMYSIKVGEQIGEYVYRYNTSLSGKKWESLRMI